MCHDLIGVSLTGLFVHTAVLSECGPGTTCNFLCATSPHSVRAVKSQHTSHGGLIALQPDAGGGGEGSGRLRRQGGCRLTLLVAAGKNLSRAEGVPLFAGRARCWRRMAPGSRRRLTNAQPRSGDDLLGRGVSED
ncbi:hypothetical protein SKAU_G00242040 [Synaphobranchus kaupii]|uniref:Secreted protein n=1 Tax=Synaphobranchus kaupii TaxID=118154 RepID=A0A9Q1F7W2_SYNKA|nr:hypothetical protein SKAU_G00242040 [Synaphobranchus kaupii]